MIEVLIVHIFIVGISIFLAKLGVKSPLRRRNLYPFNLGLLISFLVLLCLLGFRDNLGRDWNNYVQLNSDILHREFSFGDTQEFGYICLVKFLDLFNCDFSAFIFITSFLILFLFFISYRRFYFLLPFGIFVFFTDWGYPVSINTIRQSIALMCVLNAALYINNHEYFSSIKFLSFCIFGSLFHYSIIVFLPFYFLGRIKLKLRYLIILCLFVSLISFFIFLPLYDNILGGINIYEGYVSNKRVGHSSFGLGALLMLLIRYAPIAIYSKVRRNHPEFVKFFIMYFIGLSLYYPFYDYLIITRITFFLQFFELFVISYFIYYLFVENKKFMYIGVSYVLIVIFNYVYNFEAFLSDQLVSKKFSLMFMEFYFSK